MTTGVGAFIVNVDTRIVDWPTRKCEGVKGTTSSGSLDRGEIGLEFNVDSTCTNNV